MESFGHLYVIISYVSRNVWKKRPIWWFTWRKTTAKRKTTDESNIWSDKSRKFQNFDRYRKLTRQEQCARLDSKFVWNSATVRSTEAACLFYTYCLWVSTANLHRTTTSTAAMCCDVDVRFTRAHCMCLPFHTVGARISLFRASAFKLISLWLKAKSKACAC